MAQLLEYQARIAPGLVLVVALLLLLPRTELGARLCVHIGLFILVRDAMTPVGLWKLSALPVPSLQFTRDRVALLVLTLGSLVWVIATTRLERALAQRVQWWRGPRLRAIALGMAAAVLIAAPGIALAHTAAVTRPAPGAIDLALVLLVSLVGNAYEELLFRGLLQSSLSERIGEARAAWISGLAFAFGHVPLAISVTSLGAPVLIFTAYEGLICANLYRRMGLVAATLAHGGGIFLLSASTGG